MGSVGTASHRPDHHPGQAVRLPAKAGAMNENIVDMKIHSHFLLFPILLAFLSLVLGGCKREPPALAATPPPVVMVSLPVDQEVRDYYDYTGRTAAVDSVEV